MECKPIQRMPRRHGIVSVIAMMYLMLFTVLAVGFYAASTMSVQISKNDRAVEQAQLASESGLQFVRYQLGNIVLDPSVTNDQLLSAVATALGSQLNGTRNMNGNTVSVSNGSIYLPSQTGYMSLDPNSGTQFRIQLWSNGPYVWAKVTGTGSNSSIARAVEIEFQKASHASSIFNYGVASKSAISMAGNVKIVGQTDPTKGSVLSATGGAVPLTMTGSPKISGDFSYSNSNGTNSYASGTIAGYGSTSPNFSQHVHAGVTPPLFPFIDTSSYYSYTTNTYTGTGLNGPTLINAVIPPNANLTFSGGTTIQGVLYIQTPNKIKFAGNVTITGAIVVENNPQGDPTTNSLYFGGNVSAQPMSSLPSNSNFPAGEKALTGAFILAPQFSVTFTGNFGTIGGSIVASQLTYSGNAGGVVDGTVINLNDTAMSMAGTSDIVIASTGTSNYPAGVSFGNKFAPLPGTYDEVSP